MANDDLPAPTADQLKKEPVPYYRYAFHNVYNYTLLSGIAAASLLTQQWWMAVVGVGAEALWMIFGPDSKLLRSFWFDKQHARVLRDKAALEMNRIIQSLPREDGGRIERVQRKRN